MAWSFRTSSGAQKTAVVGSVSYAARVYRTSTQSITDSTWTSVAFDNENYDYGSLHSNVTNNSRLTAPTSGVYNISGESAWAINATGDRFARVLLNGTTPITNSGSVTVSGASYAISSVETSYYLTVGEYVEFQVLQTSGASLGLAGTFTSAGLSQPHFAISLADTATVVQSAVPIGTILDYYGTTLPSGYLWCDGSAIPAQYTAAIAAVGANTPDLRGRVAAGLDNIGGSDAGRLSLANTIGTAAGSQTNSHTHSTNDALATRVSDGITGLLAADGSVTNMTSQGTATKNFLPIGFPSASINVNTYAVTSGAPSDTNIMQPTLLVNKIIRVEA